MNPVRLIKPRRHGDERGWFMETFSERSFDALGHGERFVQDNHSLSRPIWTLRGLHFQRPPHAQAKLVRCVRGAIHDVAVDLRKGSPTYGKSVSALLTAENGHQLFIPASFAHGFLTLEPETEVVYKVTDFYAPAQDAGIRFDDADLAIDWQLPDGVAPLLSPKDSAQPSFAAFESPFAYDGRPLLPLDGA
jgi:dTDP-4-dehydrorhamnose 3,5-epimerase